MPADTYSTTCPPNSQLRPPLRLLSVPACTPSNASQQHACLQTQRVSAATMLRFLLLMNQCPPHIHTKKPQCHADMNTTHMHTQHVPNSSTPAQKPTPFATTCNLAAACSATHSSHCNCCTTLILAAKHQRDALTCGNRYKHDATLPLPATLCNSHTV